ncbi:uncharacterized protein LOC100906356 [Galendromus occidentalis]|uniref:Uncharacterized protein LOC100906356 n=1 Tax=Galendromus occidentalis TaxID=34638 RepID=A0AAJ6QTU4_9ACAR|nr:uncharacterized protein LOC100906356 [Galendromus occidentalis]
MFSFVVFFCIVTAVLAQQLPSGDDGRARFNHTEDLGMPKPHRTKRGAEVAHESPVRMGATTGRVVAGFSRIASTLPQFIVDGRHYWPSDFSLTKQIGLQGVNELVNDVFNYEKTKALAVAREASCGQRANCLWNKRLGTFGRMFGRVSRDQELLNNLDCDTIFAGCLHYH